MIEIPEFGSSSRSQLGGSQLGPNQRRIVELLREVGDAHSRGIARTLELNHGNVKTAIDRLLERGVIEVSPEAHPDKRVTRQYRLRS